jgi:hypothetical protein
MLRDCDTGLAGVLTRKAFQVSKSLFHINGSLVVPLTSDRVFGKDGVEVLPLVARMLIEEVNPKRGVGENGFHESS